MQFPRILFEFIMTPNDRAAIMGGAIRKDDIQSTKIRFVQTGERAGHPIIVIEEAGEADSMGITHWHKKDLPAPIALALLARHNIGIDNANESIKAHCDSDLPKILKVTYGFGLTMLKIRPEKENWP